MKSRCFLSYVLSHMMTKMRKGMSVPIRVPMGVMMRLMIIFTLAVACEKDPQPLTTNSVITGRAQLYYHPYVDPPYYIKVVASGPYGQKSAITDEEDVFVISGLGNGTYYLDYYKEGYGTMRQYGIQLFGGDTVRAEQTRLFKEVEYYFKVPDILRVYLGIHDRLFPIRDFICIEFDVHSSPGYYDLPVMFFADTKSDVSWQDYAFAFPGTDAILDNRGQLMAYIEPELLPFKSGEEVFLVGYACNTDENSAGYLDAYLGTIQYSTLQKNNHSNTISFIMP